MKRKKLISICRFFTQLTFLILFIIGFISFKPLMIAATIIAIMLGPFFCGWMCFVGFYQDIARYIGRLFIKKEVAPSTKIHNILRYSRYLILVASLTIGGIFLLPNKIWGNLVGLLKGHLNLDTAFYCLIAVGILSLFTNKFFCRYLCPIGAKLGLYSLLRPITINRSSSCISCGLCAEECPMQIPVDKINSLASADCINCLKCVETCPKDSLKIGIRNYLKP